MDPRWECAYAARPRPAHAGRGGSWSTIPGDDQPHMGGEDPSLSPVQRGTSG